MCQAAGEWHLVGISSWRKGCSNVGPRPRLYDRVSVNSEWARKTVEHLEDETDLKEIRRRDHQVEPKKAGVVDKRARLPKKDDEDDEEEETDSRTELPDNKQQKDKTS
jgi:hypothetical protein